LISGVLVFLVYEHRLNAKKPAGLSMSTPPVFLNA
jgi:hypothetical protein